MKFRRLFLPGFFVFPLLCSAASKEIIELQRDVAQLQEQVRNLQQMFTEKMATLGVLAQQTLDATNKTNTAVAALEGGIREQLREQGKTVAGTVAAVNTRIEQMSSDFQTVSASMADLTARMAKLEQQIMDLGNAVKTLQTPAAPPPPVAGAGSSPAAGTPAPPAEVLYQNAFRDKSGGKYDLALQEFGDYLKYYPDAPLAPNAQFQIGDIHFSQGDFEAALKDFDLVLEKYPANNKTPDALYMKGQTLVKMGKRTAGANEFRELIRRYPNSDLSAKARSQLKQLGLPISSRRK